jgi:hypothetical protein
MVIVKNKHFPCIIYMREKGNAIGTITNKTLAEVKEERRKWFVDKNTLDDKICRNNCLDVCIDYNNKVSEFRK